MTPAELRTIVAEGESFEREFKSEDRSGLNDAELVESVVCLANGSGGTLFVGVEDDGRITNARPRHGGTTDPRRVEALVTVEIPGGDANRSLTELVARMGREGTPFRMVDLLLLHAIRSEGTLGVERAATVLQREESFAREMLARLVEHGLVEARGEKKGRSYHLSASAFRDLGEPAAYVRTRNFEPLQQEQMVLKYAQEHGAISRREAADLCRIAGPHASRLLAKVAHEHRDELQLVGAKRGARYEWVGPPKKTRRRRGK